MVKENSFIELLLANSLLDYLLEKRFQSYYKVLKTFKVLIREETPLHVFELQNFTDLECTETTTIHILSFTDSNLIKHFIRKNLLMNKNVSLIHGF